jgi:hypothetical protein
MPLVAPLLQWTVVVGALFDRPFLFDTDRISGCVFSGLSRRATTADSDGSPHGRTLGRLLSRAVGVQHTTDREAARQGKHQQYGQTSNISHGLIPPTPVFLNFVFFSLWIISYSFHSNFFKTVFD